MQAATTFLGFDHSDSAEAAVDRWVARLEQLHHRPFRCEVVIDHAREFHVHVMLEAPGIELASVAKHGDIYLAIADAFRAAHAQLRTTRQAERSISAAA